MIPTLSTGFNSWETGNNRARGVPGLRSRLHPSQHHRPNPGICDPRAAPLQGHPNLDPIVPRFRQTGAVSVFALVHGSMHGAWCWRDLIPELERRGHRALAADLPCDDGSAGLAEYAAAVEAQLGAARDVILVGHSMGGRTLPAVASHRPVSRLIFLCCVPTALGPIDPDTFSGMVTDEYATAEWLERADGARRMEAKSAVEIFYHDCDPQTADWAAAQLRWQGPKPLSEPSPIERWPDVPRDVILARNDRAVRMTWARSEALEWLDGREPILMDGSHSPFLSRPADLADVLVGCCR